jgi:oligoendopeptidase F
LAALKKMQDDLTSPKGITKYLQAYFKLDDKINALTLYANMEREMESSDQGKIARHEFALNLTEELMREGAVLRQAAMSFSKDELKAAIDEVPELEEFLPYFNSLLRRADRMLSPG